MDLKCKKMDCQFNKCYACCATGIKVGKDCNCKTYSKDSENSNMQDASKNMFEVAPDVNPFRHNKSMSIKCDACKCLFNDDCICKANGITVDSGDCKCLTNIKE